MNKSFIIPTFLFLIIISVTALSQNIDPERQWSQFRGYHSMGILDDADLPQSWDMKDMENVLWNINIPGLGLSSPVVWGDRIFITRTGSMLAHLEENDLIEIGLEDDNSNIMLASSELVVHREIYQNTSALAIVHVHPPFAVALSMAVEDAIIPIDSEGSYLFRKVPVVQTETTVGSKDVAKLAAEMLREYKIFM